MPATFALALEATTSRRCDVACRWPPKPYLASFDISRAFDGVPTERLLGLAQRLLAQPSYTIVKYSEVTLLCGLSHMCQDHVLGPYWLHSQGWLPAPSAETAFVLPASAGRLRLRPCYRKAAVDAGAAPPASSSCNHHIISDVALHGLPQASAGRLGLRPRYRKAAVDASAAPPDFPAFARGVAAGGVGAGRVLTDQVTRQQLFAVNLCNASCQLHWCS